MKYSLLINKESGARSIRVNKTGEVITEQANPELYLELRKKALVNRSRKNRDDIMTSFGLTKVRGAVSGRTYWE